MYKVGKKKKLFMVRNVYLILSLMKYLHDFECFFPLEPEYLYGILIFVMVKKNPHCLCEFIFNGIW